MFIIAHNLTVAFSEQQINHNAFCSNICCQCAVDKLHGGLMHILTGLVEKTFPKL